MKRCPQKKNRFPQKNWISLLNSAGIKQKSSVNPTYNNLYHYAGNNPIKYTDPDGRDHGMPPSAERVMAARQSCSYGMTGEIKQRIADNERTGSWDIYSIKSGTVVLIQSVENGNQSKDYGNSVIIQDTDGTYVRYAHLESIDLQEGDWVSEGQIIGKMGNTGNGLPTPNKHLHVSVYPSWAKDDENGFRGCNAITNPEAYIKSGTYPANTKISGRYKQRYKRNDGSTYKHEGTDFSGQTVNQFDGWQKGLNGKDTIDAQN